MHLSFFKVCFYVLAFFNERFYRIRRLKLSTICFEIFTRIIQNRINKFASMYFSNLNYTKGSKNFIEKKLHEKVNCLDKWCEPKTNYILQSKQYLI